MASVWSDDWNTDLYANFFAASGAKFDTVKIEAAIADAIFDDLRFGGRVEQTPLLAAAWLFGCAVRVAPAPPRLNGKGPPGVAALRLGSRERLRPPESATGGRSEARAR